MRLISVNPLSFSLGQLITLAGIDQSQMAIPRMASSSSRSMLRPADTSAVPDTSMAQAPFDESSLHYHGEVRHSAFHDPRATSSRVELPHPNLAELNLSDLGDITGVREALANTTGLSTIAGDSMLSGVEPIEIQGRDVSGQAGGLIPQTKPDNYTNSQDPTMQAAPIKPFALQQKPMSRFDELYQRVLRETEGTLKQAKGDSQEVITTKPETAADKHETGHGDITKVPPAGKAVNGHQNDTDVLSDHSAHSRQSDRSHGSRANSQKSVISGSASGERSRETVREVGEDFKPKSTVEGDSALNEENRIIQQLSEHSHDSEISEHILEEIDISSPGRQDDDN